MVGTRSGAGSATRSTTGSVARTGERRMTTTTTARAEGQEDGRAPQGGGHGVGQRVVGLETGRWRPADVGGGPAGGGEDGDEDAQAERTAQLLGHVDHTGGGPGVLRFHPGHPGRGERGEGGADAETEQQHGQGDLGEVRRCRR